MPHTAAPDRYASMTYVRSGRSGLLLPRISLGLWNNFGTTRGWETQRALVTHAFDRGITHFDLANNYGPPPGAAETAFGQIIGSDLKAYRDEIIVSTKAGYQMWDGPYGDWGSRKSMLASLDQSLQRTGLDYVDVFYSHRPDPETPIEETMGALATAVRQGKALYVGVSNYDADQMRAAVAALRAENIPLTIHQPRYNIFDRKPEHRLLDTIAEFGVGCIVFSPLAGGLLTDRYLQGVPADSRAAEGRWMTTSDISEVYLANARALTDLAQARGQTLSQLALAWVLRRPEVTSALVGASSTAQLDQNLAALESLEITAAELAVIDDHSHRA
ncbi:aldo/keto reductase [Microbacterium pumilum]|uniref:L-glyceraldehyde 3-phosphate reductase n=1 Tax=Microbacterium pumilum TaxID=344165 RepID=A0ABN2RNF3_9MICO